LSDQRFIKGGWCRSGGVAGSVIQILRALLFRYFRSPQHVEPYPWANFFSRETDHLGTIMIVLRGIPGSKGLTVMESWGQQ
jgi:hypothetical protein